MRDAESNRIAPHAVAKDQEKRRGRTGLLVIRVMTPAAARNAPKSQRILLDEFWSLGTLIGNSPDLAVVITETVAVGALPALTVTLDGDTEQAGPVGAT